MEAPRIEQRLEEPGPERTEAIYEQVTLALKCSVMCAQARKDFALCKATAVGRTGDPSFCDAQSAQMIKCHNDV